MVAGYVHVEVEVAQSSKRRGTPCGDVFACDRTPAATTMILADGIGSGIRAHLAAEMCTSRLRQLLRQGFSLRKAIAGVVRTMERSRDPARPFAAFSVARILNDGMATVIAYECPPPILVCRRHAAPLPQGPLELGGALVQEANGYLEPGDALLLVSDGITQAGLGGGVLANGWQTEGLVRFINDRMGEGLLPNELPRQIHREARQLWTSDGDDCTVAVGLCRRGQIVNILSGPPGAKANDVAVVRRFIQAEGLKIVCGGTTAEIVAKVIRQRVLVEQEPKSLIAPPRYEIPGVDLVTEGAVTLNQVYNVLDEDLENLVEDSGVTELCSLLQLADRVNICMGSARNHAGSDISFRQQGILSRDRIIPLIVERLRAAGKLVVLERA
jgi:hypothetical protein